MCNQHVHFKYICMYCFDLVTHCSQEVISSLFNLSPEGDTELNITAIYQNFICSFLFPIKSS